MVLPLIFLTLAGAAAAVLAYGADPSWMAYRHGLEIILLSRRLQWPLVAVAIICCLVLLAMVVGGNWRAWWLIGLAPVLALFAHRFIASPVARLQVSADPVFASPDEIKSIAADDYVVGLTYDAESYAYPYDALFSYPVVVQTQPQRRVVLIWSAFANRAVASLTDWTLRAHDLEIVSTPANSLLVYNTRLGQFINGITGLTPDGQKPAGFVSQIPTVKTTWKNWLALHPLTKIFQPPQGYAPGPTVPLSPRYVIPGQRAISDTMVTLIQTQHPVAILDSDIQSRPLNLTAAFEPLLIFRGADGLARAFLRQANGDLTPRFFAVSPVLFSENDSSSSWALDGRAVSGSLKGEKLRPFDVDEHVNLDVLQYWYPNLTVITPRPGDWGAQPRMVAKSATRHREHRRRHERSAEVAALTPSS